MNKIHHNCLCALVVHEENHYTSKRHLSESFQCRQRLNFTKRTHCISLEPSFVDIFFALSTLICYLLPWKVTLYSKLILFPIKTMSYNNVVGGKLKIKGGIPASSTGVKKYLNWIVISFLFY